MLSRETANRFTRDMGKAGFAVRDYKGRFYYEGPAVSVRTTDEREDVIRATRVRLQWDNLGLGWIIYPRES